MAKIRGGRMNKEQEKVLFGNVLPDECHPVDWDKIRNIVGLFSKTEVCIIEMDNLFDLARSQRDAIGALIEDCIFTEKVDVGWDHYGNVEIILSAVIQDTWEDVKKTWEENK
jgi:hypothetical protein